MNFLFFFSPVLTAWVGKGAGERTSKKTPCVGLGEQTDDGERKSLPWAFLQLTAAVPGHGELGTPFAHPGTLVEESHVPALCCWRPGCPRGR